MITITNILDCEGYLKDTEAVIFDMDDTLYSEKDYVRSGYRAIAAAFLQIEKMEEKLWDAFKKGLPAIDTVLKEEGQYSLPLKEEALWIYRNHLPTIQLYTGAEELLQRMHKNKKLGLITDGRPEGQRAKLEALGIVSYFDRIIITDELGGTEFRKPNKMAFCLMQESMNVPFEKMTYIGDNVKKDFIAPEQLGMKAIYFRNKDGLYLG